MSWTEATLVAGLVVALAAAPAQAACTKDAECDGGKICSAGLCVARPSTTPGATTPAPAEPAPPPRAAVSTGRLAWAGLGLYGFSVSVDIPEFGTVSSSTVRFGLSAGGALDLLELGPGLHGAAYGNLAAALGSGGTYFPLTVGAAIRYDKLPVQLLGGLGFTVVPHTGDGNTPLGLQILATGLYPLVQVDPRLSIQAQLAYNILNNSFSLWTIVAGVGYAF